MIISSGREKVDVFLESKRLQSKHEHHVEAAERL